jgi:hypothetical protein
VKRNFELHIEECEWRYDQPLEQLIGRLKELVAKNMLSKNHKKEGRHLPSVFFCDIKISNVGVLVRGGVF